MTQPWWRSAVFYEIYVRSFADGNGDGVGDLPGITSRLDHLVDLGVDALWLTPFYRSPQADHGYDVADPRDVDPLFGTLEDFDDLLSSAHARGLRVIVDVVPNHTSDQHPWFREALEAGPGSPARDRYVFRDGKGERGELPPNNWPSTFGGPAWTRVADGQWYLHLFAPEQPDLNWRNPEVGDDYDKTLRFWLERGVDGFRIDVAHGLYKDVMLRDNPGRTAPDLMEDVASSYLMWNQPEVHEVYRRWHSILADYPGDRMAVGEVWLGDPKQLALYVRPDELQQAFNFRLLRAEWDLGEWQRAIDLSLVELTRAGSVATWVLSNHDVVRHVTRYGGGETGLRRARGALLAMLALPGSVYLYQGEELGLEEVVDLPDAVLQDPIWERSGHTERGRDGCRVPVPWSGTEPPYAFSTAASTWLPMPASWAALTVEHERADPASTLALYREALRLRRSAAGLAAAEFAWVSGPEGCLAFRRGEGPEAVTCVLNMGTAAREIPVRELLLASEPSVAPGPVGTVTVPPGAAVWVR